MWRAVYMKVVLYFTYVYVAMFCYRHSKFLAHLSRPFLSRVPNTLIHLQRPLVVTAVV